MHASREGINWDREVRDFEASLRTPENDTTTALWGSIVTSLKDFITHLIAKDIFPLVSSQSNRFYVPQCNKGTHDQFDDATLDTPLK